MPSSTKSKIGSVQGSVGPSVGELVPPELQPPRWITIPNQETPVDELPAELDVTPYVTSVLPITGWATTEGTILDGILTIPDGTDVSDLEIVVTATNANGDGSSRPFLWRISLPVLPPIDPDNVYEGNNNGRVTINTGAPRNYQTPWRVGFLAYVKEHDQTVRSFVGNTSDFQGGVSATNWYVRLHSDDVLRCNASNGSSLTTLEYSTIIPEGEWLAITAGWDGVDLWLAVNGVRESMPLAYVPVATHGSFHLLGASRGWLDKAQMSTVVISDNDGEFNLAYPCAEGSGLVALDYSDNRFHGVINNEVIHATREASVVPAPDWDVVPDQETDTSDLPATLLMTEFVSSDTTLFSWITTFGDIDSNGLLTIPAGTSPSINPITVTVSNQGGPASSNEFNWEITGVIGDPPEWDEVPDDYIHVDDLPTTIDMNQWVTGDNLRDWQLSGAPSGVTIDDNGIVSVDEIPAQNAVITCYVANDAGSDTSNQFRWAIAASPTIDTQPENLVVIEPQGGSFSIVASHTDPDAPLFYFWDHSFSNASGGTTDTLTLGSTVEADNGLTTTCRVRAYVDQSEFEVTSVAVSLTANRVPPVIDTQPSNTVIIEGENTSFTVEASHPADAALTYQWNHTLSSPVSGETTPTLNITEALLADNEQTVTCTVTAYGDANETITTNPATLTVLADSEQNPNWCYEAETGNEIVTFDAEEGRGISQPYTVTCSVYIKEHRGTFRRLLHSGTGNAPSQSNLNWNLRLTTANALQLRTVSAATTGISIAAAATPPVGEWFTVSFGWDGSFHWIHTSYDNETRTNQNPWAAPDNNGMYHILGIPGESADDGGYQIADIHIEEDDGFTLDIPCGETEGLVSYDYGTKRLEGVISDESIHALREGAGLPPDWHTAPNPEDILDTELPGTLDMNDFCSGASSYTNLGDGLLVESVLIAQEGSGNTVLECSILATNEFGSTLSPPFEWTVVGSPPIVTVHPEDFNLIEPRGGSNWVEAEHPIEGVPIYYKWEGFNEGTGQWTWLQNVMSDISSATGPQMDVESTNDNDVSISPIRGRVLAKSYESIQAIPGEENHPLVDVSEEYFIEVLPSLNPVIDEQPQSITVSTGEEASFSIEASHPQDQTLFFLWEAFDGNDWVSPELVFSDVDESTIENHVLFLPTTTSTDNGINTRCQVQAYDEIGPIVISDEATLTVEAAEAAYAYQANLDPEGEQSEDQYIVEIRPTTNPAFGNVPFHIEFDYYWPEPRTITSNQNGLVFNGFSRTSMNWKVELTSNTNKTLRLDVHDPENVARVLLIDQVPGDQWTHLEAGYDGTQLYVRIDDREETLLVTGVRANQNNSIYKVFDSPPHSGYSPQMRNLRIIDDGGNVDLFYAMDEGSGLVMVNSGASTGPEWDGVINDANIHQLAYGGEEPPEENPPNWFNPIQDIEVNELQLPHRIHLDQHVNEASSFLVTDGPGEIEDRTLVFPTGLDIGTYTNNILATNQYGTTPNGSFNLTVEEAPAQPEGNSRILFTDITDASIQPWNQSDTSLGMVVTLYGRYFGSSRGSSFVRIGGIDLTEEKYYHPAEPWGEKNKPVPFIERITFHIPVELSQGVHNITVVTESGESNPVPINIHDEPILFISPTGNGADYTFENPGGPFGLRPQYQAGRAIILREGTYNQRYDSGNSVFWIRGTNYSGIDFEEDKHLKLVGAPGEDAFIATPPDNDARNGVKVDAEYVSVAKLRMDAVRECAGTHHFTRFVGCDMIGLREYLGSGTGIVTPVGRYTKTLGNRIHGARSDNQQDHAVYVSESTSQVPPKDGQTIIGGGELAYNYVYDCIIDTGGLVIRNMQQAGRIRDGWTSLGMHWHHNYVDGTHTGTDTKRYQSNVMSLGDDGQYYDEDTEEGRIIITRDYAYNNIVVGTIHPDEDTGLISVSGHQSTIQNNVMAYWGGRGVGGGISVNRNRYYREEDTIVWRNNIHLGVHANSSYTMESGRDTKGLIADSNLYFGANASTVPENEVSPTFGDPLLLLDVENGIFILEDNSPAIDLGTPPLIEDQEHDFNIIPYTGRIDAGAILHVDDSE